MRFAFGGTLADVVISPGGQIDVGGRIGLETALVPGARLWVWDPTTGERVTDLLDGAGTLVSELVADAYGRLPTFRGPDEATRLLIGQALDEIPDGAEIEVTQQVIVSTEWGAGVDRLASRVTALEDAVNNGGGETPEPAAGFQNATFSMSGPLTPDAGAHPWTNLTGRPLTIVAVSAIAAVTTGQVTVQVLTRDLDTGGSVIVAELALTPDSPRVVAALTDVALSDRAGVAAQVVLGSDAEAEDLTVQVALR